jgi:CRISPR-associated protein Csm1
MSITEDEKKQLYGVALGGLTHDIGKLMQRAEVPLSDMSKAMEDILCPLHKGQYSHKHVLWTCEFFEIYRNHQVLGGALGDAPVVNLAAYHHRPYTKLQEIIQLADRLSSGSERQESEESLASRDGYKKTRMYSILEYMAIDKNRMTVPDYRYELTPMDADAATCFPTQRNRLSPKEGEKVVSSYASLWEGLRKDMGKIGVDNINAFIISFLSLLEKYTWCVPSTTMDRPDISLFDHAKTTAAIAAALYRYHIDKGGIEHAKLSITDEESKFVLLVGDISGIQNYIFNIRNVGVGGTAKRLRARSFFLSALADIAGHKILHAFDLTLTNLVMSSGGKFYLLLPNISDAGEIIQGLQEGFDAWCMKNLNGEVAVNMAFTEFNCGEMLRFNEVLKEVNNRLLQVKVAPFKHYLTCNDGWREDAFIFEDAGFTDEERLCGSCGKFPGMKRSEQNVVMCEHCANDVALGRELTRATGVQFFADDTGKYRVLDYSFSVVDDRGSPSRDAYLVYQFNNWEMDNRGVALKAKFFANHVPLFDERLCRECDKTECREQGGAEIGNPKFFTCLAQASRGRKVLGVFKADVDNLGLIFIKGFRSEQEKVISRITTLSRLLDTFFTGRVDFLLRDRFKNTYTVYAGGDDLLVLGPWDEVVRFSIDLNKEFAEFCCNNPDLTMSAGISMVKPRLPVYAAIEGADLLLESAKKYPALGEDSRKNQMCALGDRFKWNKAEFLLAEAEKLANWQGQKKVSMSFVRLLKQSGEMFGKYRFSGNTGYLRFAPLLAYSITRNIPAKESEAIEWAQSLTDIENTTLKNLTFIANYSIHINRS